MLMENHQLNCDSLNGWRKLNCEQTRDMIRIWVANTSTAEACVVFQGPSGLAGPDVSNTDLQCDSQIWGNSIPCNMLMPKGWFLICGRIAYSYLPANATGGPCTIGRLTPILHPWVPLPSHRVRKTISTPNGDNDFNEIKGQQSQTPPTRGIPHTTGDPSQYHEHDEIELETESPKIEGVLRWHPREQEEQQEGLEID